MLLEGYSKQLFSGLCVTLELSLISLVFGIILGTLFVVAKDSRYKIISLPIMLITSMIRSLPELMILFILYFGGTALLNQLFGHYVDVSNFAAGAIALALIFGAYFSELIKSGLLSMDSGQLLVADAYGFSIWLKASRILLPQLAKIIFPGFINLCLVLLKDTAIVSLIGLTDLMQVANIASAATREPFLFYLVVAALYLLLTSIIMALAQLGFKRSKY